MAESKKKTVIDGTALDGMAQRKGSEVYCPGGCPDVGALLLAAFFVMAVSSVAGAWGAVVVNEVELGPGAGGPMWAELHNGADAAVSLAGLALAVSDNATAAFVVPLDGGEDLDPGEYRVVYIGEVDRAWQGPVTVTLADNEESLDVVQGLSDELSDGRTWQRFPDGADSDSFADWTLKESTMGSPNGSLGGEVARCVLDPLCLGGLDIFFHNEHEIEADGHQFVVETFHRSRLVGVDFVLEEKKMVITPPPLERPGTGTSAMHVTIPLDLLGGPYSVLVDGSTGHFYQVDGKTDARLILNHLRGGETVEIIGATAIPEFPEGFVTVMAVSLLAALILFGVLQRRHETGRRLAVLHAG